MAIIEKKRLPEKVIDEIRHRLETGQLKIGDKLPNQNKLSSELGVSRTSLREAMKILDLLGTIVQRPGYGTVIQKNIPKLHTQSAHLPLISDQTATYELLEAREIIECGAVRLAAKKATDGQIRQLFDLVAKMDELLTTDNIEDFKKVDSAFHSLINKASGNRFISDPNNTLRQYVHQFIEENIDLLPGLMKESQQYHRVIYQAIADHDADRAEKAMRIHIQNVSKSYKRLQDATAAHKKSSR